MARACFRGRTKKFQYITSSNLARQIVTIDGDFFASASYGMVTDDGKGAQEFNRQLPTIIQAGMQNGMLDLSSIMKLYNSDSRAEKQKTIEDGERAVQERQQQAQQQQLQSQQQIAQMQQDTAMAQMEHEAAINSENNETKILVAEIQAQSKAQEPLPNNTEMSESERANLDEKIRELNATHRLNHERLDFDKKKAQTDTELKRRQLSKKPASSS